METSDQTFGSGAEYKILVPLNPGTGSRALLAIRCQNGAMTPTVLLPIPQSVLDDPETFARLEKETDRARILEHPGILRVYGLHHSSAGLCRAVEYAHGETLRTLLHQAGKIPPGIAARFIADVASGVHYAHLAGNEDGSPLVHGDLRPETIMISLDGTAKVSGYGALTVAPREPDGGRRVVGRRKYTAPEQVMGGRTAMAPTTDVFLLGMTLYEMLTGEIPFQSSDDPENAVLIQPIPVERPEIPEPLRDVIIRATSKLSRDRYATAMDFRLAVLDAMEGRMATDDEVQNWLLPILAADPRQSELSQAIAEAMEAPEKIAPYVRMPSVPPQPAAPDVSADQSAAPPAPPAVPAPSAPAAPPQENAAVQTPPPVPPPVSGKDESAQKNADEVPAPEPVPLTPPRPAPAAAAHANLGSVISLPPSAAPTPAQGGIALPPEVQSAIAQAALSQVPTQPPMPVQIQLTLPAEALPRLPEPQKRSPLGWFVAAFLMAVILVMGYRMIEQNTVRTDQKAASASKTGADDMAAHSPDQQSDSLPSSAASASDPEKNAEPASADNEASSAPTALKSGAEADTAESQAALQRSAAAGSTELTGQQDDGSSASYAFGKHDKKRFAAKKKKASKQMQLKKNTAASKKIGEAADDDEEEEEDGVEEEYEDESQEDAAAPAVKAASTAPEMKSAAQAAAGADQAGSSADDRKEDSAAADAKAKSPARLSEEDDLEKELEAALVSAATMERQREEPGSRRKKSTEGDSSGEAAESQKPGLDLFTIPQVSVRIKGGKYLGQTPLKEDLAPGTYVLELTDPDNRINAQRLVKIKADGRTKLDVTLGVGGIYVTAPDGASIIIDGKRWGIAPINKAIELYEGSHTLRIQTSNGHTDNSFDLKPNDMLNFNFGSGNDFRR